jgi:hypothetical protein
MDEDVGLCGAHRRGYRLRVENIEHGGHHPCPRKLACSIGRARRAGDVMPGAQKERHQPPADGAGGAREEYSHFKSLIIAAGFGTGSSISREKLCPSPGAIGQPQVAQSENWYKNKRPCS